MREGDDLPSFGFGMELTSELANSIPGWNRYVQRVLAKIGGRIKSYIDDNRKEWLERKRDWVESVAGGQLAEEMILYDLADEIVSKEWPNSRRMEESNDRFAFMMDEGKLLNIAKKPEDQIQELIEDKDKAKLDEKVAKYIITKINSRSDMYGNRYWAVEATNLKNDKQVQGRVGANNIDGVGQYWDVYDGWDRSIHFQERELPIREFNRLTKNWPYFGSDTEEIAANLRKGLGLKVKEKEVKQ
jgi:hypothetical protein